MLKSKIIILGYLFLAVGCSSGNEDGENDEISKCLNQRQIEVKNNNFNICDIQTSGNGCIDIDIISKAGNEKCSINSIVIKPNHAGVCKIDLVLEGYPTFSFDIFVRTCSDGFDILNAKPYGVAIPND